MAEARRLMRSLLGVNIGVLAIFVLAALLCMGITAGLMPWGVASAADDDTGLGALGDVAKEASGADGGEVSEPETPEGGSDTDIGPATLETGAPSEGVGASPGDSRAGPEQTMWERFKQSGAVGYLILLLEIAVLTLIIEAFINVNVNKVIPTDLTLDLEDRIQSERIDDGIEICYENPGVMSNIVRAGLESPQDNIEEAKDSIDMAGDIETDNFLHRINFLSVFATIAPMLGLLGTVMGMVNVFGKVASQAALGNPEALAGGINMALLTTEYGLLVGIPAMFMYYYFKIRANKILLAVETGAKNLVKWRMHHKGLPPMGLFPNKILLGIEEALSDSFVSLFPFVGFFLGPLSIIKGLKVKDEFATAVETTPETEEMRAEGANPGNPGKAENPGSVDAEPEGMLPKKLIVTPEVTTNLWKASAAILIGGIGIFISVLATAIVVLKYGFSYDIFERWLGVQIL